MDDRTKCMNKINSSDSYITGKIRQVNLSERELDLQGKHSMSLAGVQVYHGHIHDTSLS